jgi:hypothetical protein
MIGEMSSKCRLVEGFVVVLLVEIWILQWFETADANVSLSGIPRSGFSHRVLTSRSAMGCGPGSGLVSCSFHQSQVIPDDSIFSEKWPSQGRCRRGFRTGS